MTVQRRVAPQNDQGYFTLEAESIVSDELSITEISGCVEFAQILIRNIDHDIVIEDFDMDPGAAWQVFADSYIEPRRYGSPILVKAVRQACMASLYAVIHGVRTNKVEIGPRQLPSVIQVFDRRSRKLVYQQGIEANVLMFDEAPSFA